MTNVIQFFNEEINKSHGFKCWGQIFHLYPKQNLCNCNEIQAIQILGLLGKNESILPLFNTGNICRVIV